MISYSSVGLRYSALVLVVLLLISILLLTHPDKKSNFLSQPVIFGEDYFYNDVLDDEDQLLYMANDGKNELDGCYHVYLDVGSSIGNTVCFMLL